MKYRAVVFDYGGVLEFFSSVNPNVFAAKELGVTVEEFRKEYFKHNHLSNLENMSWEDMFSKVISVFNKSKNEQNRIIKLIKQSNGDSLLNVELISKLSDLKRQGLKLAICSNNTSALREKLAENGIIKYFDEIIISGEVGHQKPNKQIFETVFLKLNVKPPEVVFIDDSQTILDNANEIGCTPILFKNNEQLKSSLSELGVFI